MPLPSSSKWSFGTSSRPTIRKRRLVSSSIAASREAPGPIRMLGDLRVQLDLEGLRARSGRRELAQAPLGIDRGRGLREDDPVAAADGALAGQDLARAVGHVLARHLDEAERRDLDHVGLRPVALELALQRLLDGGPVLRVRHVDEVDDDDPADVAQPELAHDLLDRLEVVLRDRVLEPPAGRLASASRRTGRC